jgi:hypothetical protein
MQNEAPKLQKHNLNATVDENHSDVSVMNYIAMSGEYIGMCVVTVRNCYFFGVVQ